PSIFRLGWLWSWLRLLMAGPQSIVPNQLRVSWIFVRKANRSDNPSDFLAFHLRDILCHYMLDYFFLFYPCQYLVHSLCTSVFGPWCAFFRRGETPILSC